MSWSSMAEDQAYPTPHGDVLAAAEARYATRKRDTPTGTIIARLDPVADRETWLSLRRTGIGSSDMAAVLGLSKYRSELDVYIDKVEAPRDDEAGEAAFWGTTLEDPVARVWAERHGVTVRRIGTIAHVEHRHMLCDLDRLVIGCPDHTRCALEVKTRSAWKADEWKDNAIPEDVEAQVMQQLAVTGLDAIHVAALVGGQKLESRLVVPDPDYVKDLLLIGDQFWAENVQALNPPHISSLDLLVDFLSRVTPQKGVTAELSEADVREIQHLTRIVVEADRAEAAGDEAAAKIKAIIGEDATDVVIDEKTWWTWRSQNKPKRVDWDRLEADLPEPLDAYKVPNGTTRVLRKGAPVKAMLDGDVD